MRSLQTQEGFAQVLSDFRFEMARKARAGYDYLAYAEKVLEALVRTISEEQFSGLPAAFREDVMGNGQLTEIAGDGGGGLAFKLRGISNWQVEFSLKSGGRPAGVSVRLDGGEHHRFDVAPLGPSLAALVQPLEQVRVRVGREVEPKTLSLTMIAAMLGPLLAPRRWMSDVLSGSTRNLLSGIEVAQAFEDAIGECRRASNGRSVAELLASEYFALSVAQKEGFWLNAQGLLVLLDPNARAYEAVRAKGVLVDLLNAERVTTEDVILAQRTGVLGRIDPRDWSEKWSALLLEADLSPRTDSTICAGDEVPSITSPL